MKKTIPSIRLERLENIVIDISTDIHLLHRNFNKDFFMSDRKSINIMAICSTLLVLMGAGTGIKNVIERHIEQKRL